LTVLAAGLKLFRPHPNFDFWTDLG